MKRECADKEPVFDVLQEEFKELIRTCNDDEAVILGDRFDKLMAGYTKMEDLVKNREEVCQKWDEYHTAHKDTQAKLKQLKARLANGDLTEDEVNQVKAELEEVKSGMYPWVESSEDFDELIGAAQMVIKDRASQRTLHFGSELQAMENLCDQVAFSTQQKQEQLEEVSQLWKDFVDRNRELIGQVKAIEDQAKTAKSSRSDLQGVKDLVREIEVGIW